MSQLQIKLISTYKEKFPKDTYKQISKKTHIQQTRVFRIFNGAQMKLSEYESLDNIIKESKYSVFDFRNILKRCEKSLSFDEISEIFDEIKFKLETKGALK